MRKKVRQYQQGGPLAFEEYLATDPKDFTKEVPPNPLMSGETVKIQDSRKKRVTTGKAIDPNRDLISGNYSREYIRTIVASAKRHGVDPYTALAVGMAESQLGKTTSHNIFHTLHTKYDENTIAGVTGDIDAGVATLKNKIHQGKRKFGDDEVMQLQTYNGLGMIRPSTEEDYHGFKMSSIYGVPLTEEGIDMSKNPLYGKNVIDIRDNVLKKNDSVVDAVNSVTEEDVAGFESHHQIRHENMTHEWDARRPRTERELKRMEKAMRHVHLHGDNPSLDRIMNSSDQTISLDQFFHSPDKKTGGMIKKYQKGGPLDFDSLFSGLFPENTYDFGPTDPDEIVSQYQQDSRDQLKDIYRNTKGSARKKIKAVGRLAMERKIPDRDSDAFQSWLRSRREEAVGDYFKSDYFSQGMQGLMDQFQEYQQNIDSERDPIEIDQYRVGPDQGFDISFQDGGKISTEGYRTGSPDVDEKFLTIRGNKISMNDVERPLLLVPDSGAPVYAEPNSGDYHFPGATEVVEYPLETIEAMQMGGNIDRMSTAGAVKSPQSWLNFIAPKIMQMGGQAPEYVPVQLEKGEEVIFENQEIVTPKAKKRHSQMDDYTYTDVLPEGTYVASRDSSQKLDRDHAENMIVSSMGPIEYDENKITPMRKEKNLGQLFKGKHQTPAQVARSIRTAIPTSDNEGDIYAESTNLLNLETRAPYTNALIQMSEAKGKATAAEHPDQMKYGGYAKMQDGGTLDYMPTKHFLPAVIAGAASIISGGINAISAGKARKRTEAHLAQSIRDIDAFENSASERADISGVIGAGSILGQFATQDTDYSYLNLDPIRTRTQNAFNVAGQNIDLQHKMLDETQQAPLYTIAQSAGRMSPQTGYDAYTSAYAQYLNQSNQRGLSRIGTETDLTLSGAESMSAIDRAEILDRQQGEMYEKGQRNVLNAGLFQGLGVEGQNVLSNQDRIEGAAVSAKMAARGQATSALNQIGFMQADAIDRIGHGVANTAWGIHNMNQANQAGNIDYGYQAPQMPPSITQNSGYYPGWTWNEAAGMYFKD